MHFVDDVYLVTRGSRRIACTFNDFAHIVHARVGRGIDFRNVDMRSRGNRFAVFAFAARLSRHCAFAVRSRAVEGFGDNAGGSRFTDSPYPRQNIGLGDLSGFQGVCQSANQSVLTNQVGESRRAVFSGKHPIFCVVLCHLTIGLFNRKIKGNRTATRFYPLRLLSSEPDRIGGKTVRADFPDNLYLFSVCRASIKITRA